jgi:hypothetical protein
VDIITYACCRIGEDSEPRISQVRQLFKQLMPLITAADEVEEK